MSMLLRDARVWDGRAGEAVAHCDVLVEDGTIVEVRPTAQPRATAGLDVVDVAGAFVMPGLIDMHVHLMWSGSPNPVDVVDREGEQITAMRTVANAQAQLAAGVTTVRDVGSNWDLAISLAKAVSRGHIVGPRVVASGKTIIMTGGHDPFWGIPCDGVDAVVRGVRTQVYAGAGCIKVAATGGVYGRPEGEEIGQSELSFEELRAAASEAHRFGLHAAAHALGTEGIANSVRAGIDTIEHGIFLNEEVAAEMRERGTALTPTLLIYRTIAEGSTVGIPAYAVEKAKRAVDAHQRSVKIAMEYGIDIIAGTDAGSCNAPHASLVREIESLHDAGLSTVDALRAATSTAAKALRMTGSVGTIEPGAHADLLVIDGDPLSNVSDLRKLRHVVRGGRIDASAGARAASAA